MAPVTSIRLIDVHNLQLKNFGRSEQRPTYNILSHMWSEAEVDFSTFEEACKKSASKGDAYEVETIQGCIPWRHLLEPDIYRVPKRGGWAKIAWACWTARNDTEAGADWIWIDTCCIDKNNREEQQETIAAMTALYGNAKTCYAFLQDVSAEADERKEPTRGPAHGELIPGVLRRLEHSRWFSRGWTLQELLAPRELHFYDYEWRRMESKEDLIAEISRATGIAPDHLEVGGYRQACVAVKMSWMAHRYTERVADMAYALLGLHDISMPLDYPNGAKEFLRMQQELIKQGRADESIFVWTRPSTQLHPLPSEDDDEPKVLQRYGLLAPWPTCFAHVGNVTTICPQPPRRIEHPYRVEDASTLVHLPAFWPEDAMGGTNWNNERAKSRKRYDLSLNCWVSGQESNGHITIRLARTSGKEPWVREVSDHLIVAHCKRTRDKAMPGAPRARREAKVPNIPDDPSNQTDWPNYLAQRLLRVEDKRSARVQERKFKVGKATLSEDRYRWPWRPSVNAPARQGAKKSPRLEAVRHPKPEGLKFERIPVVGRLEQVSRRILQRKSRRI